MHEANTASGPFVAVKPSNVFRPEALRASRRSLQGEPSAACGVSMFVLSMVSLGMVAAIVVFAFTTSYSRKATIQGYIEPAAGLIKVRATATGQIDRLFVCDGDTVQAGDALVSLDLDTKGGSMQGTRVAVIETLEQQRGQLEAELAVQREIVNFDELARQQSIAALDDELSQLDREIALQANRTANARRSLQRIEMLAQQGDVADVDADAKSELWLEQRSMLEGLRRQLLRGTRERQMMLAEAKSARLGSRSGLSRLLRELAELDQKIIEQQVRRRAIVTASVDGIVSGILQQVGQRIGIEAPLMTIVPSGSSMEAKLFVPARVAGSIAPRQKVRIRYAAFPHANDATYGGEISEVSATLLLPGETELPIALDEPAYPVRVTLDQQTVASSGVSTSLKAGMRLDADVLLDRRRIVEWLFEPLFAGQGRQRALAVEPFASTAAG